MKAYADNKTNIQERGYKRHISLALDPPRDNPANFNEI